MKRFKTLTDEEIVKAIAQVEEYGCAEERKPLLRCLFTLLANSGLRITEALTLTWRNIDFERGELTVRTLKQQQGKGFKRETEEDTLPLDAHTLAALRDLWKHPQPSDYIFTQRGGKPLHRRVAYNIWVKLQALACIRPVKVHALRHSAVTRWIEQTGDLTFAQRMARHKSVASTAQYVHCRHLKERFAAVKPIG